MKRFFALLEAQDYKAAYALWVRTDGDRRGYPFSAFMQDWGPQSEHRTCAIAASRRSRSCGSGVILTVDFGKNQQEKLWVERDDLTIGFSPLPGCPRAPMTAAAHSLMSAPDNSSRPRMRSAR